LAQLFANQRAVAEAEEAANAVAGDQNLQRRDKRGIKWIKRKIY
jgi:hypothetical protein